MTRPGARYARTVPRRVTVKKRCCKSEPRCKRCPTVLRRLERAGLAEREHGRVYVLAKDLRGRHLKAARRAKGAG